MTKSRPQNLARFEVVVAGMAQAVADLEMRHHAAQETHRASRPAAACSRRCCAGATEKISAMSRLTHVAGIHLGVECSITDAARSTPVGERPCHGRKARLVGDGGTPARACSKDGPGGSHYFFLTSSRLSRGGAPPGDSGEGWARTLAQRQRIAPRGRSRFPGRTQLPVPPPPRGAGEDEKLVRNISARPTCRRMSAPARCGQSGQR